MTTTYLSEGSPVCAGQPYFRYGLSTGRRNRIEINPCPEADSKGTEFVVAFMETMTPSADPSLYIIGASARSTRVTIQSPGGSDITVSISHESRVKVVREEGPSTAAVLITSDREVTVYGVEEGNSMDSFLVLPTDALGTEYYVVSYSISDRLQRDQRKSQFTLLGVSDDTVVDITLSGTLEHEGQRYWNGDRIRITLNRLQVVHFASADDDLTSTRIVASKKIGVLSGSKCADVPVNMRFCDHLVEMLPPVKSWGRSFITSPLYGRRSGDAFRIMAARDDTAVAVSSYGRATLHAGEFFELEIMSNSSRSITADKPLLVMQYSLGGDADQTTGDPFMMLVPAIEQFSSNAVFYTIDSSYSPLTDYANVIIECPNVRGLEHNLFELPQTSFSRLDRLRHTLDGREYCMAQMVLARGVHFLRHSQPDARFALTLYGAGVNQAAIAYGMPAGLRLPDHECEARAPVDTSTSTMPIPDTQAPTSQYRTAVKKPGQNISPLPGPSVNGTPARSSGECLTWVIVVTLFLLVTILFLVVYICILRSRVRKLEAERKVCSRMQLSPVVVGADGYIGLDGSQHPERDYMTLNNPQGVWRLCRVRRTGRSPGGVPYMANTAINTNSNGISHISEPTLVSNNRNSLHGASVRRKGSAPETLSRTISMDSNHALRFSRRNSGNDALSASSRHGSTSTRNSPPLQICENVPERQNGTSPAAAEGGNQSTRKQSFQELHDIAECPDKEPPPRTSHLVRSISQPSYQTSLKVNAPKVYYSVPKNNRARNHYDHPRKRSSSVEEPCPVIFSMKESLLKHDDGYMSMRDHRTSVSSQGSSNMSLSSSPVALPSPDTTSYSFVPDETPNTGPDTAETDSTDYTELF
ncbi:uncharacterized protein LOC110988363 [Acanthaster planci]|uniref:Uncharacterized protein LOC110988363 n=1 Tax=Acanthaster planci TaxID=133434 RepID=A0A8B7ZRH4_ACAPL|nr:uncharacterized protein LOC110988363 [Acanthaster planci]